MFKRIFLFVSAALLGVFALAQEPAGERLQRTPEEEALQQTMRLVRE